MQDNWWYIIVNSGMIYFYEPIIRVLPFQMRTL